MKTATFTGNSPYSIPPYSRIGLVVRGFWERLVII